MPHINFVLGKVGSVSVKKVKLRLNHIGALWLRDVAFFFVYPNRKMIYYIE